MLTFKHLIVANDIAERGNENELFTLDVSDEGGVYTATLTAKQAISSVSFTMESDLDYTGNRIYVNGYQSWSPAREYLPTEKMPRMSLWAKLVDKVTAVKPYGDYNFANYSLRAGYFHGFSYGYVTQGDSSILLFGSLNERTGYTQIYYDCPKNLLRIVKDLEGISLKAGESYTVMQLLYLTDEYDAAFDAYFAALRTPKPRIEHKNGYTSWYNYYQNISEEIIIRDLEHLSSATDNIDIFQVDDGYQTAVGDWLSINPEKFPNGMKAVSEAIHKKGYKAGLWLAPFGAENTSKIRKEHPDWLIKSKNGKLQSAGGNWSGFYSLDIYNEEARQYITRCFRTILDEWDFDMVKLDFLYQVCQTPRNGKTRGQLMCEAMDFLRDIVGDKLILGCGVPMWPSFGLVDFCRIGADVVLKWKEKPFFLRLHMESPSCRGAVNNTVFRRHLDGRAFCNDPDVCLLRDNNMFIPREQRYLLATINKVFGNLLFISDDVALYDEEQRQVFSNLINNSKITDRSAKYVDEKVLEIAYTENGQRHTVRFDVYNGDIK